jgi:hypothetical protein
MPLMLDRHRTAKLLGPLARRAAMLPAVALLAACGSMAQPQGGPTSTLNPDYRAMIASHLNTAFTSAKPSGPAEISDPRWVQSNKAWAWQVCIHFQDRGHLRTYVVFIKGSEFVDERYAIQTDGCGAQTYSEFELNPMGRRPGAVGDPGPLY